MFLFVTEKTDNTLKVIDKMTQEWTTRCARGEEYWVCADCGVGCPNGMPDECAHGHKRCTDIIIRDKKLALGEN